MAVPDFQSLMLPLLQIAADGQEHTSSEAGETLAQRFHMTAADLKELLPSGKQSKYANRIGWRQRISGKPSYSKPPGEENSASWIAGGAC